MNLPSIPDESSRSGVDETVERDAEVTFRETLLPAGATRDSQKLTWTRLRRAALAHFGVRSFRTGQMALIEAVLHGHDAFGTLPTGAGKSLCFQLPALFLPKPTIVVSPLLALMNDQEQHLLAARVPVRRIDSTLSANEEREAQAEIEHGSASVIYVTPERLENPKHLAALCARGASLVVVDEAHCVSQWGHDFRPAYLALERAVRLLGRPPVLALTATATSEITSDVLKLLGMDRPIFVNTGVARENLSLHVVRTPNEDAKRTALMGCVRKHLQEGRGGVGIVYVATVRLAEELRDWLVAGGIKAGCYHGRLPARERKEAQARFMGDDFDLMVATNAFGLGIDKPDVRYVVHYNFPDSLERYYQEVGRAGRDGQPARATLLYRLEDRRIQTSFLGGKYPRRKDWESTYDALVAAADAGLTVAGLVEAAKASERRLKVILAELEAVHVARRVADRYCLNPRATREELERAIHAYETRLEDDRARVQGVMHYAQSTACRARALERHFGDAPDTGCGRCDNCLTDAPHAAARASERPIAPGHSASMEPTS